MNPVVRSIAAVLLVAVTLGRTGIVAGETLAVTNLGVTVGNLATVSRTNLETSTLARIGRGLLVRSRPSVGVEGGQVYRHVR